MNNFEILDKLGDGAYSVVYKVKRKQDNTIYALKKVKLKGLSEKEKQNALNEVRILASVKSNFVISYKEAFIDEEDSSLCLVMEYADKGDLYQKITQFKKMGCLIEEIDVWRIFIQMTKGLKALHDLKILHRDLKSANIFLFSDGSAKIGDLNVSKVVYKGLGYTQTGTPYYASPEVWKDQPYDCKSDIWSLGCVTFEMLALRPPFRAENMEKLFNKVIRGQYGKISERYSDDIREIIKFMLKVNPQERPSCGQILNHELVKKRLEFFQAQAGYDEENMEGMDEGVLLKTIRIPKNILFLTERLPEANYNKRNNKLKQINIDGNKKKTFPNNSLPDIKFQFNNSKNQTINNNTNNSNIKKRGISELNSPTNSVDDKLKNKNSKKLFELNDDINRKIQNNNLVKNNRDLININNIELKMNRISSNQNLKNNEEEKKQLNKIQKDEIYKLEHNIKHLLRREKSIDNRKNKNGLNSNEKKEYEQSILNQKKYQNKKRAKLQRDDFQNYLKSIGLGDMYKLCMPNINDNIFKNYNNRYRPNIKNLNLPNIYSINKKINDKNNIGENKIIPNRRLVPIGKKIV